MRGGAEKVEEAGAVVVGGHSIKDKELKFGISVTGIVDPHKVVTNSGAKPGDVIFLTKPLGTGLITTGIKRGKVGDDLAMVAIQGPNARAKVWQVLPQTKAATENLVNFQAADCGEYFVARTGYTGEDGFEVMLPKEKVEKFW